jgi:DNA-binding transcriptional MerR regulator
MRSLATSEVLRKVDIPRSTLYYLEQKGYVSPRKMVIGEKSFRFYSPEDVRKIGLIWVYLKQGMRYSIAYQKANEQMRSGSGRRRPGVKG